MFFGPVVQLNRTSDSGSESRGFESRRGHQMKKSTHPLFQLMVLLAIALGMLLVASVVQVPFVLLDKGRSTMLWMQAITQCLTFLVPMWLMTYIYYRGQESAFLRFDFGGGKWMLGLAGVVAMLLMVPLIDWLTVWNDSWDLGVVGDKLRSLQEMTEGILQQLFDTASVGGLLANLLVVALVPAVCEEVFFRAGVQNLLQRWFAGRDGDGAARPWATHAAIWVTALIFSLVHGELFAFMPRFVMGALLGYLYVYGGSIVVNSLAHFANNATVVVLYWLSMRGVVDLDPEAPLQLDWLLTVCCTLAALGVLYVSLGKKMKISS